MGRDQPQTASAESSICPLTGSYRLLVTRTNLLRVWRCFPGPTSSSRSPPFSFTPITWLHQCRPVA